MRDDRNELSSKTLQEWAMNTILEWWIVNDRRQEWVVIKNIPGMSNGYNPRMMDCQWEATLMSCHQEQGKNDYWIQSSNDGLSMIDHRNELSSKTLQEWAMNTILEWWIVNERRY